MGKSPKTGEETTYLDLERVSLEREILAEKVGSGLSAVRSCRSRRGHGLAGGGARRKGRRGRKEELVRMKEAR